MAIGTTAKVAFQGHALAGPVTRRLLPQALPVAHRQEDHHLHPPGPQPELTSLPSPPILRPDSTPVVLITTRWVQHVCLPMKRSTLANAGLVLAPLLLTLVVLEGVVRAFSEYDRDGNAKFVDVSLYPYRIPLVSLQRSLDRYNSSTSSRLMYDPDVGWSPRPNVHDWVYHYNSTGIRSAPAEYTLAPAPGTFRIALFGDSYTHCDEVPIEECWGTHLEARLRENGIPAEVINFGVSGYGIDQALLRWHKDGRAYAPHLVILGFNADDVSRNVNLLRAIRSRNTGIPLAKPRFIIEGEDLRLINVPTTPPEQMLELFSNLAGWDLVRYEYFYRPRDYDPPLWLRSRLVSFVFNYLTARDPDADLYALDGEPGRVTLRIIQQFSQEVQAASSQFVVLFLPQRDCLGQLSSGQPLPYADLLAAIEASHPVIHPETPLLDALVSRPLEDLIESHYTPLGNRLIAEGTAAQLLASPWLAQ